MSSSSSSVQLQPPPAPTTTRHPTGPVSFLEYPSPNATSSSTNSNITTNPKRYLLFFISGNPGLIDYYAPFFTHLRSLLNELESKSASTSPGQQPITFHIYGQSLIGFSDSDHQPFMPGSPDTEPFVLEEQISHLYDSLVSLNQRKGPFDEIIIAGHSVGSFLSLEILHRSLSSQVVEPSPSLPLPITTALLLFPTIHQMHLSPSGLHLSRIRSIPFLNNYAHVLAKSVVDFVPRFALRWITRKVLGMSEHGSEVTARFLQSRDGIWQAIHLGKDEMGVIRDGEGRWGWWASPTSPTTPTASEQSNVNGHEEVVAKEIETVEEGWEQVDAQIRQEHERHEQRRGGEGEGKKKPRFFLYFGQNDHWVADRYRDEFIERRKRDGHTGKEGGTKIVIDEDRIPHAFCINHSEQVAEKVRVWIEEVVDG